MWPAGPLCYSLTAKLLSYIAYYNSQKETKTYRKRYLQANKQVPSLAGDTQKGGCLTMLEPPSAPLHPPPSQHVKQHPHHRAQSHGLQTNYGQSTYGVQPRTPSIPGGVPKLCLFPQCSALSPSLQGMGQWGTQVSGLGCGSSGGQGSDASPQGSHQDASCSSPSYHCQGMRGKCPAPLTSALPRPRERNAAIWNACL